MKINDKEAKEGVIAAKSSPANGISVSERYKLTYFGSLLIDKRYTSCMLPWIVAEIKRKCEKQTLDVDVGSTQVTGTLNETIVEHRLVSISKCIKLEGKEASTFAYLTKDPKNTATCSCHVFEAESTSKAGKFLVTLKKALEECKRQLPASKESEDMKVDPHLADKLPREEQSGVKFDVTYIGKLAVSHRRAPPTLIDTSVERFRHHNQQVLLTSKLNSLRAEQNADCKDAEKDKDHHPPIKALSFDATEEKDQLSVENLSCSRPRSVSDGTPDGHKCVIGATAFAASSALNVPTKSSRRLSCLSESRSLFMHICINSVSFSSSLSGKILMERKVQEISFCQQGTTEPEHFGFICHDAKSSHYHCYVFRAESKHAVDNIMKSLRQAFNSAWQAVGTSAACENCPLHKLHRLCQSLEGEKPVDQEITIRHHLYDNLGESVVEDLKRKYQVEAKKRDVTEQNEIMMSYLRQLYEEMQKVHRHSPNGETLQIDTAAKEKPGNKFIAKAKRSLGDIFRSKTRNLKSDHEGTSSDEADAKVGTAKLPLPVHQRTSSVSDMPSTMESITEVKPRTRPKRTHRRSYSDINQVFNGPSKVVLDSSDSREHVSDEETFVVEHPRSQNSNTSTPKKTLSRESSYRRAIFDSVVTPTKLSKNTEGLVPGSISEDQPVLEKKTREQLRALWQKAIMEQRILIRMEKENSKLRAGEGIAKNKRLKLEYDELLPKNNSSNELWNKLLAIETTVDIEELVEAVKFGVPKNRRGEIWQFLLKQDLLRNKRVYKAPKVASYKELKETPSVHQHAILIDCSRTFPAHPYFSQHVGVGQFALFNLLKVYSNLDPELGYCQGLSFVAGVLLMHLGEEEAFDVLKHINFNYGLRHQYMPDMAGLRVQFYQYSRLLHDTCPNLYDHFQNYEVTPTLYAASWFLTLFASLFPVSFACRVLDLLCLGGLETVFKVSLTLVRRFQDKILACENLETVVEFLKVDLPKLAVDELESIVEDVLAMEIGDQLLRFEVEYQVFQEEEIDPPLTKPLLEKIEKLTEENKNLKNRGNFLKIETKQYQRKEKVLLEKVKKLEVENKRLLDLANERCEGNGVRNEDVGADSLIVGDCIENCRSPIDDNTDSFEHIMGGLGADETDDDIDALSCDSPLTIEDSLCDKSSSPNPSQELDECDHKWTKL